MPPLTRFSHHSELWDRIPILQMYKSAREESPTVRRGPPVRGLCFVDVAKEKLNEQRNELESSPQQGCFDTIQRRGE